MQEVNSRQEGTKNKRLDPPGSTFPRAYSIPSSQSLKHVYFYAHCTDEEGEAQRIFKKQIS